MCGWFYLLLRNQGFLQRKTNNKKTHKNQQQIEKNRHGLLKWLIAVGNRIQARFRQCLSLNILFNKGFITNMKYLLLLVLLSIVATVLVNADSIESVGRGGAGGFPMRYTKVYYPYLLLPSPLFSDIGPLQQQIQQDKYINFVEILAILCKLF